MPKRNVMEILRRLFFILVACSSQVWAEPVRYYEGTIGTRQAEFSLEWGENASVKGECFYTGDNQAKYRLQGSNKTEGLLEIDVYKGDMLTARMALQKKNQATRILWEGVLKGSDGKTLAVSFSRIPDAQTEPSSDETGKASATGMADKAEISEKVVKDPTNGALVWRPYSSNIQWAGNVNGRGFAEGKGTLVVFDRKGNRAAIITGMMKDGHLIGDVTAKYPTSPDRAHYIGGYSNWSENGKGTMTYNDGKVVTGTWKSGELVAVKAEKVTEVPRQSGETVPRSEDLSTDTEPPDPDTATDALQKTYDKLKNSLQGEALQNLKVCQRAWIKYNETALKISTYIWDKPNDPWEGADRFDALMAWHRTRELQLISDSLLSPKSEKPLPDDLDDQVALLAGKLRQINMIGNIEEANMAALKQYWDQSCQLTKLADLQNEPPNQTNQTARSLLALASRNLNEVLDLWLGISPEVASTDSASREIPKASTGALPDDSNTVDAPASLPPRGISGKPVPNDSEAGALSGRAVPVRSPEQAPDAQLLLVYSTVAFLVAIALIGVFMGVNERITIYNGNWDFGLTCITAGTAIAAVFGYSNDDIPFMGLFIFVTCVALLMSFRESLMANESFLRAALAVPAKFILIVLIVLCGLMALGGARSGMDELKKGNRDKAAMQFAIAAAAGLGAGYFHRLIKKLIKERVSRRAQPLP